MQLGPLSPLLLHIEPNCNPLNGSYMQSLDVCVCRRHSDRQTTGNEMHFGTTIKIHVEMCSCVCVSTALHEQNECIFRFLLLLTLLFGEQPDRLSFCPESLFALLRGSIVTAFN